MKPIASIKTFDKLKPFDPVYMINGDMYKVLIVDEIAYSRKEKEYLCSFFDSVDVISFGKGSIGLIENGRSYYSQYENFIDELKKRDMLT